MKRVHRWQYVPGAALVSVQVGEHFLAFLQRKLSVLAVQKSAARAYFTQFSVNVNNDSHRYWPTSIIAAADSHSGSHGCCNSRTQAGLHCILLSSGDKSHRPVIVSRVAIRSGRHCLEVSTVFAFGLDPLDDTEVPLGFPIRGRLPLHPDDSTSAADCG
jgi:hypothetical protein